MGKGGVRLPKILVLMIRQGGRRAAVETTRRTCEKDSVRARLLRMILQVCGTLAGSAGTPPGGPFLTPRFLEMQTCDLLVAGSLYFTRFFRREVGNVGRFSHEKAALFYLNTRSSYNCKSSRRAAEP